MPERRIERPRREFLEWHLDEVFKAWLDANARNGSVSGIIRGRCRWSMGRCGGRSRGWPSHR